MLKKKKIDVTCSLHANHNYNYPTIYTYTIQGNKTIVFMNVNLFFNIAVMNVPAWSKRIKNNSCSLFRFSRRTNGVDLLRIQSCIAIQPKCTTSVLPLIPAGSRVVVLFSPQRRLYRHQISNLRSRSTPLFCFELISTIYSYYRKKKHSALKLCTIWSRWKKQSCIYTQ